MRAAPPSPGCILQAPRRRTVRRGALLVVAMLLLGRPALAEERARALVLGADQVPWGTALVQALRIHLGSAAVVEVGPAFAAGPPGARVDEAARLAALRHAAVALWPEDVRVDGGAREFLVFIVGSRRDRALLEVVRLRGDDAVEASRALALKVREVLDASVSRGRPPDLARPLAAGLPGAPPRRRLALVLEAGGTLAGGAGPGQAGLAVAVGARRPARAWDLELVAALRTVNDIEAGDARGRVQIAESDVGAGARLLTPRRRVRGGLWAELALRILHATGTTATARTGADGRLEPVLAGGLEGRLTVAGGLEIRAAAGIEGMFRRVRFAVNGEPLAELGGVRAVGTLSLAVIWP